LNYATPTPSPELPLAEANLTNETPEQVTTNSTPAVDIAGPGQLPPLPVAAQKKNDIFNLIFSAILLLDVGCAVGAVALWYVIEKK
jgi:hypothetical protein